MELFNILVTPEIQLEELYQNGLLFTSTELTKARIAAPVGTIKMIGDVEYIKTNNGWRYHKRPKSTKQEDSPTQRKPGSTEPQPQQKNGENTPSVVKTGHTITAPDGTKGQVVSVKGEHTTIKYEKDGEEKTAQVPTVQLENKVKTGDVSHSTGQEDEKEGDKPKGLEDHHKQFIEQAHKEGKSSVHILSQLQKHGVDDGEAMKHLLKIRSDDKKKPKVEEDDDEHEDHDSSVKFQADKESDHNSYKSSKQKSDTSDKQNEEEEGFSLKDDNTDTTGSAEKTGDKEEQEVNRRFEVLQRNVRNVIKGRMKSMIAYGTGGVGKTYSVTKELERAGKRPFEVGVHEPGDDDYDYVKITGKVTATDLYKKLMEHNGKIILFDDCDSVLQDKDAQNLFKGALDTSGDGTINWGSARPPKGDDGKPLDNAFKFNGRCMFISNLDLKNNPKAIGALQPIVSRGTGIDLSMSPKQTLSRIKKIAVNPKTGKMDNLKFPGIKYTENDMKEVMSYLDKNKNNKNLELNVRTIGALLGIKQEAEHDGVDWQKDADYHALKKSQVIDIYNGSLFEMRKSRLEGSLGVSNNFERSGLRFDFHKSQLVQSFMSV